MVRTRWPPTTISRLRCPARVAGEPLLAGFEEVFRPAIVKVLVDAFLAAQFGNAVVAAQAVKLDPGGFDSNFIAGVVARMDGDGLPKVE